MKSNATKSWMNNACCVMSIFSALIIGGCATEATKKPEVATAATGSAGSASRNKAPTGKSEVSSRQTPSGSSLDALRSGKPPAEGPLKNIFFEFDSYSLSADARAVLKANAAWLKANPSVSVEIEGHCDERGTTEYNLALGAKRSRSALDYLVSLGVSRARIKTTSFGEELPVCKEGTESCYEKNRRDRFVEVRSRPTS